MDGPEDLRELSKCSMKPTRPSAQLVHFIDHKKYANSVVGSVSISIHSSLYRACKLTFPQDIWVLARDSNIDKELGIGSMSHAVSVLTPSMFDPVLNLCINHDGFKAGEFEWPRAKVRF